CQRGGRGGAGAQAGVEDQPGGVHPGTLQRVRVGEEDGPRTQGGAGRGQRAGAAPGAGWGGLLPLREGREGASVSVLPGHAAAGEGGRGGPRPGDQVAAVLALAEVRAGPGADHQGRRAVDEQCGAEPGGEVTTPRDCQRAVTREKKTPPAW